MEEFTPPPAPPADAPLPGMAPTEPPPPPATSPVRPLYALLGGALLAVALVGFGMVLGGRRPTIAGMASGEQERIIAAVAKVAPAVMNVDTELAPNKGDDGGEFLPDPGTGNAPRAGKGTGVIIDRERAIMLTNAHVVTDPDNGKGAKNITVTTRDGQKFSGKLLGRDRSTDIAVVKLNAKPPAEAKLAPMKDARDISVGQWAIAIGNPFGQANTVTVGVISAVGRTIPVPNKTDGAVKLTDMIQTDTAINPGNSGGPLCNVNGEVVGINTAILNPMMSSGLGYSIPIIKAKQIADQLIAKGRIERAYLGIAPETITDALKGEFGLPDKTGVLVRGLQPNSPATKAGIVEGDVLRSFNGQPIKDAEDFQKKLEASKVGDTVKVEIMHEGAKKTVTMKLTAKPDSEI